MKKASGGGTLSSFIKFSGFTLAEMMVVLLIMTIILAAMAPVMTTRMSANKAVGGNSKSEIWKYVEDSGETDIYYGTTNNQRAMIGQNKAETAENARLILNTSDDIPNHLIFKNGNKNIGQLQLQTRSRNPYLYYSLLLGSLNSESKFNVDDNIAIGFDNKLTGSRNIALGSKSTVLGSSGEGLIAIGYYSSATGSSAVAIGNHAKATTDIGNDTASIAIGNYSSAAPGSVAIGGSTQSDGVAIKGIVYKNSYYGIAIGDNSTAGCNDSENTSRAIAIGEWAKAYKIYSIAIGSHVNAKEEGAIGVGSYTSASGEDSIAIGNKIWDTSGNNSITTTSSGVGAIALGNASEATGAYSIAIGSAKGTGVNAHVRTTASATNSVAIGYGAQATTANTIVLGTAGETVKIPGSLTVKTTSYPSDRNLKNIGKEYTSSLDKIKQLKPFNFTYKDDKNKTPRVGVIAQDLQKVFPNAVSKGKDGFLTIRMEDMFYAVINAIKELDAKESEKDKKIKDLEKRIELLEQRIK